MYKHKAHKNMLNTANYQRNTNQKCNEVSPHILRMVIIRKTQIIDVSDDVKEKEPLYSVYVNVKMYSHCGKQYGNFSKN